MRSRAFMILVEEDEDHMLVASCPSLKGCHTQAKDMATLLKRMKEVLSLCVKVEKKFPKPMKFVGLQEVRVAA